MSEENGNAKPDSTTKEPSEAGERRESKKHHHKDWLAVGGIGIEKRRRSSNASYRIENNKVLIDTPDGGVEEFEIVATNEKHGSFRKAVPTLPVPLAVLCLFLNIIPGLGTTVSAFAVLCGGYPTEHETRSAGVCWNLLAAILQVILAPIIVGIIWSMQRGVIIVQESLKKKIEEREEKAQEAENA